MYFVEDYLVSKWESYDLCFRFLFLIFRVEFFGMELDGW